MTPDARSKPLAPACESVQGLIDDRVDAELDPEGLALLDEHLAGCDACRQTLAELQGVRQTLRELPPLECPAHVVEAVCAKSLAATRRRSAGRFAAAATVAIAATLLLVIGVEDPPAMAPDDDASQQPTLTATRAETRAALAEVTSVVAQHGSAVGQETLRRGFVEPLEKALAVVGQSRLGRWGASAQSLLAPTLANVNGDG